MPAHCHVRRPVNFYAKACSRRGRGGWETHDIPAVAADFPVEVDRTRSDLSVEVRGATDRPDTVAHQAALYLLGIACQARIGTCLLSEDL
jgi:hypothetical protein